MFGGQGGAVYTEMALEFEGKATGLWPCNGFPGDTSLKCPISSSPGTLG